MPSQIWRLDGVLDLLERIDRTMGDRSYAFILGAGASVSSGIPSGKSLAQDWLNIIHKRECMDDADINAWLSDDPLDCKGSLSVATAAEFYPRIFERCFRGDHDSGYAALEAAMDGKTPGIGYSFLAEIIATTRHKVVVTTNFDNLVADALAMHAHQSPRIVGHEALAGFVRPYSRRPLIAKIHRDLLFSPINDQAGVDELSEPWKNALRKLFQHYTPIFIGYGGNDGSLMGLLDSLQMGEIAGQMIWCYRDDPPRQALDVLEKHNGIRVKISDFDEFMLRLAGRLIKDFDAFSIANRIKTMGDERSEAYRKLTTDLHASLTKGNTEQKEAGALLSRSARDEDGWWSRQMRANAEPDLEKRRAIYAEAVKLFPTSGGLHANFANFLCDEIGDFDLAEEMYIRALELEPKLGIIPGNYASFLSEQRNNVNEAEKMYKKALELDPRNANIMGNYANFLNDKRMDLDAADLVYAKALELAPAHPINISNYATFLSEKRGKYDEAELLFKKLLELQPTDPDFAGNYAQFLAHRRQDPEAAKLVYERVLEATPKNAANLRNYANFLWVHQGNIPAAEANFKSAIELDPSDAHAHRLYAEFLSDAKRDFIEADAEFKKAVEISPQDADLAVRYASFLYIQSKDLLGAEAEFRRAHTLDPDDCDTEANLAAVLLTLARDENDLSTAYTLCQHVLEKCTRGPTQTEAEALLYLCIHADLTSTDPTDYLRRLKRVLQSGYTPGEWNFSDLFDAVLSKIPATRERLYRALGNAILDSTKVVNLDEIKEWANL
jgi:Tfp pilus assembly protein PilF